MPRHRAAAPGLMHLRVAIEGDFYMGPGRAELLQLIGEAGSISAAGKRMGMSYKRAWGLVQALNDEFGDPLVVASRGGAEQGGAVLTPAGEQVLRHYRQMQDKTRAAIAEDLAALVALKDMSGRK